MPPPANDAPTLITINEAAKLLRSTPRVVRKRIARGELQAPQFAVYEKPRVLRSEVERLARSIAYWRDFQCSHWPQGAKPSRRQRQRAALAHFAYRHSPSSILAPDVPGAEDEPLDTAWLYSALGYTAAEAAEVSDWRTWDDDDPPYECPGCRSTYPTTEAFYHEPPVYPWPSKARCRACTSTRRGSIARRNAGRPDAPTLAFIDMLRRDPCSYCGALGVPIEIDHITPASAGGPTHYSNLTAACKPCNRRKRTKNWFQNGSVC